MTSCSTCESKRSRAAFKFLIEYDNSTMANQRLVFLDNIRWTVVILVLTMHASDTYSPFGNWYYTARPGSTPWRNAACTRRQLL